MPGNRKRVLVAALCLLVILCLALVPPGPGIVRAVAGLLLVLVLPGYAVMAAVFPRMPRWFPDRLLLSTGLSLSIVALGGLVLHLTTGMRAETWAVLLGAVTLGAGGAALWRRRGDGIPVTQWQIGLHWQQWLLLGLAVVTGLVAVQVARAGAIDQPTPGFTQLWSVPAADVAGAHAVRIGVANMEAGRIVYDLRVKDGDALVYEQPALSLEPQTRWEMTVTLPAGAGQAGAVDVQLFREDQPGGPYRQTLVWMTADGASTR